MSDENQEAGLTSEQERFLEECYLEFSERFTDSDLEYKKVYDSGVPPPPIMCPWYGRSRFNNRDRAGGSRNDYYRPRHQHSNYQDRDRFNDRYHDRGPRYSDQRFRPY